MLFSPHGKINSAFSRDNFHLLCYLPNQNLNVYVASDINSLNL